MSAKRGLASAAISFKLSRLIDSPKAPPPMLPCETHAHAHSLPAPGPGDFLWIPQPSRRENLLAAFRATFELDKEAEVDIQLFGAHYFEAGLDDVHLAEGPWRFPPHAPEHEVLTRRLGAGRHVISALVMDIGVHVEYIKAEEIPPFFLARVLVDGEPVAMRWRCTEVSAYQHRHRRISANMAWVEWIDMAGVPRDWEAVAFDDSGWAEPVVVEHQLGPLKVLEAPSLARVPIKLEPVVRGRIYAHDIEFKHEDPGWAFYARRFEDPDSNGFYLRFDLGRVALGKLQLKAVLPKGTEVAMACCDFLLNGRVTPWIVTTENKVGTSNLNFLRARGDGEPEYLAPVLPRGGRHWEVHIQAPMEDVEILECAYLERTSAPHCRGAFACDDSQMEKIWRVGVNTLRACSEDAILDCPTRERGQWGGDGLTVGMEVAHAAGHDMRLLARGLRQAASCARADGLVAGLYPGAIQYLPTYSLYWASACWRYLEITGDESVLRDLLEPARRNFDPFRRAARPDGLADVPPDSWPFVDWGYAPPAGEPNIPMNVALEGALGAVAKWEARLGHDAQATALAEEREALRDSLRRWKDGHLAGGWEKIGYHAGVFLLRGGLLQDEEVDSALDFLKAHILSCYPNDRKAPRLGSPCTVGARFLTPFFSHFALPPLVEAGEMDFVLGQFRSCWGWALTQSDGTWVEVFDPNWSHCHQWSGAPTWMLTRYLLGLRARQDLGRHHFDLAVADCAVPGASGVLPFAYEEGVIRVNWTREGDFLDYRVESPLPVVLHLPAGLDGTPGEAIEVQGAERIRTLLPEFPPRRDRASQAVAP